MSLGWKTLYKTDPSECIAAIRGSNFSTRAPRNRRLQGTIDYDPVQLDRFHITGYGVNLREYEKTRKPENATGAKYRSISDKEQNVEWQGILPPPLFPSPVAAPVPQNDRYVRPERRARVHAITAGHPFAGSTAYSR